MAIAANPVLCLSGADVAMLVDPAVVTAALAEGFKALSRGELQALVRTSDVICLTTSSASAVIDSGWVAAGSHVTSLGYTPPGTELPSGLIDRVSLYVEATTTFESSPVGCAELAGRRAAQALTRLCSTSRWATRGKIWRGKIWS